MLITLVIIGVIAALTIPNLMQKYTEQTTVKKVQKFYSNLANAYNLAIKENGTATEWGLTGNNSDTTKIVFDILIKPYFKIAKDCGHTNNSDCIANVKYKYFNDTDAYNYRGDRSIYKIILDDGSCIWIRGNSTGAFDIYYDVNGKKGPNKWGHDLLWFYTYSDRAIVPAGLPSGSKYSVDAFDRTCNSSATHNGHGCAAWVIYKGNMDYLHCEGLTWKNNSCKDK